MYVPVAVLAPYVLLLLCCSCYCCWYARVGVCQSHHKEGEVAIAEQAVDHEREREEPEPQDDVHVLLLNRTRDPAHEARTEGYWGRRVEPVCCGGKIASEKG